MKKLIALALLVALAGCSGLTVKATFEYPAKAAVAK
jgi:hypothetical protein